MTFRATEINLICKIARDQRVLATFHMACSMGLCDCVTV